MTAVAVVITRREQAELLAIDIPEALRPDEVRGRTVASLVSPGTELAWHYRGQGGSYPMTPGYAAVFQAEEIGKQVTDITPGDLLFCMGGHRSIQQHAATNVLPVPTGLRAQEAVLARLMGVSMTTLRTTAARPGDIVLVTGAGPVGYLCAQQFRVAGYDVYVVDPLAERRQFAAAAGIVNVAAAVSEFDAIKGKVALVVDCSGDEQAVLDAGRALRKRGELVLVGVPWQQRTELSAHELLHLVFHHYIVLRSGWEWELPHQASDFRPHSIFSGFDLALRWLAEGRIPAPDLIKLHQPRDAQAVYQQLLHGRAEGLFQVFVWPGLDEETQ